MAFAKQMTEGFSFDEETPSHRLAAATAPFSRGLGQGGPGVPPLRRRAGVVALYKKGVCCTTQAQDKPVEAPVPEIEESGSDNGPAPFRRLPAPAATTRASGVRPP